MLEVNGNPEPFLVGLVAEVADAFDFLLLHEEGDLLNELGLIHLVGNLGDDDLASALLLGNFCYPAHEDGSPSGRIGCPDVGRIENDAPGREIRSFYKLEKVFRRSLTMVCQISRRIHHFRKVVRRDISGHTDRDAESAIE